MKKNITKFGFPKNISNYTFTSFYRFEMHSRVSKFALYKNKNGKIGFAKMISYANNPWERYWLKNEQLLNPILTNIPTKLTGVFTPKIINTYSSLKHTVLLFEFVNGYVIKNINMDQKISSFDKTLNYIDIVNKSNLFKNIKRKLVRRNGLYFLLLFPFFALKAFMRHPEILNLIKEVLILYISSFIPVSKDGNLKFIHRDLNDSNIMISKNKIAVIDFQSSMIADSRFEIANIAINMWIHKSFRNKFYKTKSVSLQLGDSTAIKIYKFYSLYAAFFEISKRTGKIEDWLYSYLKHSLSPNLSTLNN